MSGPASGAVAERLVLHEYPPSGNCYKVRLTAALLGRPLERRRYDTRGGETRTPAFLARINPNGRVPVLQIGERYLPESNAAILWLAEGTALVPADAFDRATMLAWLFFEQNGHEPNIAALRNWLGYVGEAKLSAAQRGAIASKRAGGEEALGVMEAHLARRDWFVGDAATLADVALYAYTHVAGEGGFDLGRYPAIRAWFGRVEALPGYLPLSA